jgi:stress-induced morphogen
MTTLDDVKNLIQNNLNDAEVFVSDMTGTLDHLAIFVATDDFEGLSLIEQHQKIMDILREDLKEKIHAVKIKTMTKSNYLKAKNI